MKLAVVGCGALGSFYGAKLCRAGHETWFLLRTDYEVVRRHGVRIRSRAGELHVLPRCANTPQAIGVADVVLIGLKTTANDQFPRLLPPLVGPQTAILTLQNGLGNEQALARLFPEKQILGGLAFVCLNRVEPGVVHHIDHGHVVLGEYMRKPEPRTQQLAAMFQQARVPCEVTDDLARAHWEKLIWNIPFNGLGVASSAGYQAVVSGNPKLAETRPCLTTEEFLADRSWERLVRELMSEVIFTARALGFDLPVTLVETNLGRTRTMGAYKASSVIDYERGQPLELDSLFLEPLRQARKAGVATPRLAALAAVLRHLNDHGRLSGDASPDPP